MTTRPKILTLLFFLFSSGVWAQKLSLADSVRLLATWKKSADYLRTKDTIRLRTLCLDSVDCKLCGFRDDTITDTHKPLSYFVKYGLDNLNSYQKLWKIIDSEQPKIIVSGFKDEKGNGERIYYISYLYWKPGEIAKNDEGGEVVFGYVLRHEDFKLFTISTVP